LKRLLAEGVDVNPRDNGGWTPLHEAALDGHVVRCEAILHQP